MPEQQPDRPRLTIADLRTFLDELPDLEVFAPTAARSFVRNVSRYLDTVGVADTDTLDDLPLADLADLYRQARPGLNTHSYSTYGYQLTRAITMLTARAADDPLWALNSRDRKTKRRTAPARTQAPQSPPPAPRGKPRQPSDPQPSTADAGPKSRSGRATDPTQTITYPFPLRDGRQIQVTLPAVFPVAEAERLCAFITAVAVDPSLPTG
jgi:hypothetical protein